MSQMSDLDVLSKSLSFKGDVPEITRHNTQKKHSRTRSASSPVRPALPSTRFDAAAVIAPAADNQERPISPDMVMDTFMSGLDKWNGIFRNAMVVRRVSQSLKETVRVYGGSKEFTWVSI